jgi:hypothetical protein
MKTIFEKTSREELINRINALDESSRAQWGKMNISQMLQHLILWEDMMSGRLQTKRMFISRIFGKLALKQFLNPNKPVRHNTPTVPQLIVKEKNGDVAAAKKKLAALIEEHSSRPYDSSIHPFFGKMTREQVGCLDYKHIDHHLQQFNA